MVISSSSQKRPRSSPDDDVAIVEEDTQNEEEVDEIRDRRSMVWKDMERIPWFDKTQTKAKCNHCKQVFTAKSRNGTSHL